MSDYIALANQDLPAQPMPGALDEPPLGPRLAWSCAGKRSRLGRASARLVGRISLSAAGRQPAAAFATDHRQSPLGIAA
jgi:hypothetical protein